MEITWEILATIPKPGFAARCKVLGLTAYGDTKELAAEKLKRMMASYVEASLKRELLLPTTGQARTI